MTRAILYSAAALLALSPAAFAQTSPVAPTPVAPTPVAPTPVAPTPVAMTKATTPERMQTDGTQQNGAGIREELRAGLEKAGFRDITIVPGSLVVRALDKKGDTVTMLLSPDSMTMVTTGPEAKEAASTTGMFTSVAPKDDMSSMTVGLQVYNGTNQDIGTIKDIAYEGGRLRAYIVGVGGFLGMGDHYVAVRPSAMKITWNTDDKKWHTALDTTADALKAAPEYKYPSAS
jgi:hypothetical protein